MTEWRNFLSEGSAEYSGILMIKPDPATIAQAVEMQKTLPPEGVPLEEKDCLLYTSPSPRDRQKSRMPSSA